MAEITASLVKELREMTGAGMMECKKALVEAEGDMEMRRQDCGTQPTTDGQNPYSHATLPAVGANAP